MTWFQAKDNATALGGYLTTVNTKEENDWLTSTFYVKYNVPIWIGANDNTTENTWVWDNGTTSGDNGVTDDLCGTTTNCRDSNAKWSDGTDKWNSNEPDDWRGQDCANIWISTGAWNDRECETDTYYGIIEFD